MYHILKTYDYKTGTPHFYCEASPRTATHWRRLKQHLGDACDPRSRACGQCLGSVGPLEMLASVDL